MKIVRSNYLEFYPENEYETVTLERYLKKECIYKNPKYDKALQRSKNPNFCNEPIHVSTFKKEINNKQTIFKVLKGNQKVYRDVIETLGLKLNEIEDKRIAVPANLKITGKPRDKIQKGSIKSVLDNKFEYGILSAPPAMGKSFCAVYIACKLNVKTLIVVDMNLLIEQFVETITRFTKLKENDIGIIRGTEKNYEGKDIIIATAQTLSKDKKILKELSSTVSFLIIDEVQVASCDTIQKIIKELRPKYQLGLSGTPYRDDHMDFLIREAVGPIVHVADRKDLVKAGSMITPLLRPIFLKDDLKFKKYNLGKNIEFRNIVDQYYNCPKAIDKMTNLMMNHLYNEDTQLVICKEKTMVTNYYKALLKKIKPTVETDVEEYKNKEIKLIMNKIKKANVLPILSVVNKRDKTSYEKKRLTYKELQQKYKDKLEEHKKTLIIKYKDEIRKIKESEWHKSKYISQDKDLKKVIIMTGELSSKTRNNIIDLTNAGEIKIIITTSLMDKAVSINRINVLYLLFSTRERNNTIQRVGRCSRAFNGKTGAIVYDVTYDHYMSAFQFFNYKDECRLAAHIGYTRIHPSIELYKNFLRSRFKQEPMSNKYEWEAVKNKYVIDLNS